MAKLHTLTVPDMLWINLQVTGSPQAYDFAKLEEGTFYQYKNGQNNDLPAQAARFLKGFRALAPFAAGNEPTAFVACLAFLEMNHKALGLAGEDAHTWAEGAWSGSSETAQEIERLLHDHDNHPSEADTGPRKIIEGILNRYRDALTFMKG